MIEFIKDRDFGEVMSDTFNFFIKEFMPLAKILLIFIGPFILIDAYFTISYQGVVEQWREEIIRTQVVDNLPTQLYYMLLILFLQIITIFTIVSAYIKLRVYKERGTVAVIDIWNTLSDSIINVVLGVILVSLGYFLGIGIIGLLGIASLAFLFFLIWTAYITASMFLLIFIIVYEKKTLFKAISRTLIIVKKKRWFVFGSFILFLIILSLLFLIILFILNKLMSIVFSGTPTVIFGFTLQSLLSIALWTIMAILPAYLYASFVSKKEAPDLLEKISKIKSDFEDDESENN